MDSEEDSVWYGWLKLGLEVLIIISLVGGLLWVVANFYNQAEEKRKQLDLKQLRCASQPLDGWIRITRDNQAAVFALHKEGKVMIVPAETLRCRDVTKSPVVEIYLREWWYRPLKGAAINAKEARVHLPYPMVLRN